MIDGLVRSATSSESSPPPAPRLDHSWPTVSQSRSRKGSRQRFGKGALDGVAAPESANNAASTGSMLPMLTLGIPGSPTTAILLGGMVIWGLEPGPRLFTDHSEFVWG